MKRRTYANPSVLQEESKARLGIRSNCGRQWTHILWTKSPNRLRYADNLEGPPAADGTAWLLLDDLGSTLRSKPELRLRMSFSGDDKSTPVAVISSGTACEWECEWFEPSSPPRTRRVFSMKKKAANPKKIPSLMIIRWAIVGWRFGYNQSPNKDIPFFLNHDKADVQTLIFPHEWVWDEVQEYVGQ